MQVAIFYRDRETHTPLPLSSEPPPPLIVIKVEQNAERGTHPHAERGTHPQPHPLSEFPSTWKRSLRVAFK